MNVREEIANSIKEYIPTIDPIKYSRLNGYINIEGSPSGISLVKNLKKDISLKIFDEHLQFIGTSGSRIVMSSLARWLVNRSINVGVEQALYELYNYAESKKFEAYKIMLLNNLHVAEKFDLGDGVEIIPIEQIPDSFLLKELQDRNYMLGLPVPRIQCLLIKKITLDKFHTPSAGSNERNSNDSIKFDEIEVVRLLLSLSNDKPKGIQAIASGIIVSDDVPRCIGNSWSLKSSIHSFFLSSMVKTEAIRIQNAHEQFLSFSKNDKDKFVVILRHLNAAASYTDNIEKAIHLRVALEALFLSDNEMAELSYRLALRAAIFCTDDHEERKRIQKLIKDVYKLCSSAVHNGNFSSKQMKELNKLNEAMELLVKTILKILEQPDKKWIDWNSIELGNYPDKYKKYR